MSLYHYNWYFSTTCVWKWSINPPQKHYFLIGKIVINQWEDNSYQQIVLVGGLEHGFYFSILRRIIPTDFHIFQRGWNHQQIVPSFRYVQVHSQRSFVQLILAWFQDVCGREISTENVLPFFIGKIMGKLVINLPKILSLSVTSDFYRYSLTMDLTNSHRIGWWAILQDSPIFDGKNPGFL